MKITHSLLVLLALATGAFAQPTPAKQALAHEVIVAMHADRMFDGMVAQTKQASSEMLALPPTSTPEQRQKAEETQAKIMELTLNAIKGMMVKMNQLYAELYTDAELNAMKGFFSSPEGQSMLSKQAQVMARIRPLLQDMQRDLGPKLEKMVAEAKPPVAPPAAATPGK